MTSFTELATTLQTLFTDEAEDAARQTGWTQRRSKLSAATFVQTLVFGWLDNPCAPLEDLADLAADLGADVSPQALHKRLNARATQLLADVFTAALHRTCTATPLNIPLLRRFQGVYLYDTTTCSLPAALATLFPGCGGSTPTAGQAALKCHVGLELLSGALDIALAPGRQPDVCSELANGPLPKGALRLADRGFFDLKALDAYDHDGVYWISRLPPGLVVRDAAGQKQQLAAWLEQQPAGRLDVRVTLGEKFRLNCRLFAVRVPPAVAAKRQQRLQRQAKKKGRTVSAASLTLCGWKVAISNAPASLLQFTEVWVLLRARWQIELLFKLWKSHGGLDKSLGQKPARVLCEVYAKLLGMVVQHWTLLVCGGPMTDWSYPKAARRVRRQALTLVVLLGQVTAVVQVLERLRRRLQKRCRVQDRGARPSTYQLLLDPDRGAWDEESEPFDQGQGSSAEDPWQEPSETEAA